MESLCSLGSSVLPRLWEKLVDFVSSEKDGDILKSLQNRMTSLRAKASDVDEEIKRAELSGKRKRKREVDDWLEQVQTFGVELVTLENQIQTEGCLRSFFCRGRAAKLEIRMNELVEQMRNFGELVLDVHDITGDVLLTKGMIGDEFEKNLKKILRFLSDDKVLSIGICGMGGVGKSTLAKHVYNKLRGDHQVAWITISQEFSITKLQDEIAKFIGITDLSDERDEDKRASRLYKLLSKRKNLVFIFDDVWKAIDLNELGVPLSVDGCRLLITTRLETVCHQIECKVIPVRTLKENEAWDLFKSTLGQQMNLTLEVQDIAKSMVELCAGLPLGIVTIARSMKGETDFHVWSDALAELKESVMGNENMEEHVFRVLKYSFDRLLDRRGGKNDGYSKYQLCFLYCSLYPEDYGIDRSELIRKFILEEFLDKRESRKALFSQGHVILDKLVNICLLERVDATHVRMHDLVRAMALKITEGKTKVIAGQYSLKEIPKEGWTGDLEKMSLMESGISTIPDKVSPNCPKLSTLLLECNPLEFIPHAFFLHMHSLFILDLSHTRIKELPDSLSDMVSLKALLLTNCWNLEYVPCLGKLKELKELDLTATAIRQIPQGLEELFNLKFLSLWACEKLAMLPNDFLSNHQSLQCLFLPHHICASVEELKKLQCLEAFRGRVQDACDYNRLIRSRPSLAYDLSIGDYILSFNPYISEKHISFGDANQLGLAGFDFNSRENKDVTLLAQCTKHLRLNKCKGLSNCFAEDLPRLNNPNSIETLEIYRCEEIEWLMRIKQSPDRGAVTSTSPPLPHAFFSSLSVLIVSHGKKMKKLGLLTSQLQNLKVLRIDHCEMIEEMMGEGGESAEASVVCLPKLEFLYLRGLPRLKSICSVTMVCSSIQYVVLVECQALEKLPLVFGQPNYDSPPLALKGIYLWETEKEWWEKLELGHTSHHSLLQPFIRWA